MSLTRFRSQSHQLIPTNTFTIQNAQRVTYDQNLCPYCDHSAIGNEIHILLQCPGTKHIAKDLVATLTTLLTHSHQPTWNSLTLYQQTSIMLADPPTTLPKRIHQTWLHATLSHILTYIAVLETHLYNMSHALPPPSPSPPSVPLNKGNRHGQSLLFFFFFFPVQSRDTEFSAAVHGGHLLCR